MKYLTIFSGKFKIIKDKPEQPMARDRFTGWAFIIRSHPDGIELTALPAADSAEAILPPIGKPEH
jgi:hypothetical protein